MEKDEELERIKIKKLREMLRKRGLREEPTSAAKKGVGTGEPVAVTDSTFDKTVKNHGLVVIDCWAPWCGPCHIISPILEDMARDYAGKILFGKLNVDDNRRTAIRFQVMSIPTLLVFKDGSLIDRVVGAMPRQILEKRLTQHL